MKGLALKVNPIVLIIINVLAPSMYIILSGKYLQIYLLVFASAIMLLMGRYKGLLVLLATWLGMMGTYWITMQYDATKFIGLFFIVLAQSVPCIALAAMMIRRYNSAQLLSALETLHIPRMIVVAVTITLKYIPTFRREFGYITESMRLRGISFTWKKPIQSFQYFIVPQLFRCAALSEEVTAAGLVKGIDAPMKRSSYFEEKMRVSDFLILGVFFIGLAGGFVWQKL